MAMTGTLRGFRPPAKFGVTFFCKLTPCGWNSIGSLSRKIGTGDAPPNLVIPTRMAHAQPMGAGHANIHILLKLTIMKSLLSIIAISAALVGLVSAEPVNKCCPVTGKPVLPNCKTTYEGKEVAFCSGKCCKEFKADPKKFADKIK
jgi:YHS domain-containing protein